jgi:hypothetical protein
VNTTRRLRLIALLAALTLAVAPVTHAGRGGKLPPETLRGPARLLEQYPTPSLATPAERDAATRLLSRMRASAARWRNPRAAAAAGFEVRTSRRPPSGDSVGILHAEHLRFSRDRRHLDPRRPETLVFANAPGRPLVLIGVMFSMPRGGHGPTPGGPITRWHTHAVCARGDHRGLAPQPDGSCPPGTKLREGSEMLHVWFTRDLRSAFAIHAPMPELCVAGLVPAARCDHGRQGHR